MSVGQGNTLPPNALKFPRIYYIYIFFQNFLWYVLERMTNLLYVLHNGMLNIDVKFLDVVNEVFFLFALHGASKNQKQHFLQFTMTSI